MCHCEVLGVNAILQYCLYGGEEQLVQSRIAYAVLCFHV